MTDKKKKLIARVIVALLVVGLVFGTAYGIGEAFITYAEEPDDTLNPGDEDPDPGTVDPGPDGGSNPNPPPSNPGSGSGSSGGNTVVPPPPPQPDYSSPSFRVTAPEVIKVGEKQAIVYSLSGAAPDTRIVWTSSDTKIAIVDQTGLVVGISAGTADITAVAAGIKRTVTVTVTESIAESIRIFSDEFRPADIVGGTHHLYVKEKITLKYEILPQEAKLASEPAWSSDNEDVIKVYDDGVIKAVGVGSATVMVEYDTLFDTVYFEVTKKPFPWGIVLLIIFAVLAGLFFVFLRLYMKRRMTQRKEDERRARAARDRKRKQNNMAGAPYPQKYPDEMSNDRPPGSNYQDRSTKVYGYSGSSPEGDVGDEQKERFDDRNPEDRPFTLDDID